MASLQTPTNAGTCCECVADGTTILGTGVPSDPFRTAGGGGGGVNVDNQGAPIAGNPHTTLNFVGANVIAADAGGGVATITVSSNPNNTVDFFEDFIEVPGLGSAVTGPSPTVVLVPTWVGHMVGSVADGTVNSLHDGVGIWAGTGTPAGIGDGAEDYIIDWYAAVDGPPTGGDDYTAIIGSRSPAAPIAPSGTNGIGPFAFIHSLSTYGNDHWWAYYGGAINAANQIDTGHIVDALAHKFTISYVAGTNTVTFLIDGVVVATHVAIASGTFVPGCSIFFSAGGINSYDVAADYVRVRLPNTNRP
jgi:hypothetical protein